MRLVLPSLVFVAVFQLPGSLQAGTEVGQQIFQQKCVACHTIGGGDGVGPDLRGVAAKRDAAWLERWIREPDRMLAEKDPTATALLAEFRQVPMPNLGVSEADARALIDYLSAATPVAVGTTADAAPVAAPVAVAPPRGPVQALAYDVFLIALSIIAGVMIFVGLSTRRPGPVDVTSAYKLRRLFFISGAVLVGAVLYATLGKTPYLGGGEIPDRVVYVTAQQFAFHYTSDPVSGAADLGRVAILPAPTFARDALVEFRVTSVDTTHSFAIYGPSGAIYTQTQAMPGYTNRLRFRFSEPGAYTVLCLEYCGAAHHLMRSSFLVE